MHHRNVMSHRNDARQHKVAEVACYRPPRGTLMMILPTPRHGGGALPPSVCLLSLPSL